MFGASDTLPTEAGTWQVDFSYRGLRSDDHYNGTRFQYQRKALGNYVVNTQQVYDLSLTYRPTPRLGLTLSLPVVNASWSIPLPAQPPLGPRSEQNASGLGDIILAGRAWVMDTARHPDGNLSLGLGVKAPTGNEGRTDSYPVLNGTNPTEKAVDQSIQPGDGGWGILFDIQGYYRTRRVTWFGTGTYLANPYDTNGVDSIIAGLGLSGNPAFADLLVNSVPDSYVARAGAVFPLWRDRMAASIGFRIEGLPRYDLFGDSHGWRRPGYETFVEPGFVWNVGREHSVSLYVPIGLVQNRLPNAYTGNPGDATFPEYIILAGWSYHPRAR